MPVRVLCPNGHSIKAPSKYIGKRAKCPKCKTQFIVQAPMKARVVTANEAPTEGLDGETPTDGLPNFEDLAELSAPSTENTFYGMQNTTAEPEPPPATPFVPQRFIWIAVSACSLLLIVGIAVGFWVLLPSATGTDTLASVSEAKLLKHSDKLFNEWCTEMERFSNRPFSDKDAASVLETARSITPNFLMLSAEEGALYEAGQEVPGVDLKLELVTEACMEFAGASQKLELIEQSNASDLLKLHLTMSYWRSLLTMLIDGAFADTSHPPWHRVREVETQIFGNNSIIEESLRPDFEAFYADAEAIDRFLQLAEGFSNFQYKYKRYPGCDGQPMAEAGLLSWRAALTPWVQSSIGTRFHFDERWDAKSNIELLAKPPEAFVLPSGTQTDGLSSIHVLKIPGSICGGSRGCTYDEIEDGRQHTAFAIMTGSKHAVNWMRPGALPFDASKDATQFGSPPTRAGFPVLMASGKIRVVQPDTPGDRIRALFTVNDGSPTADTIDDWFPLHPRYKTRRLDELAWHLHKYVPADAYQAPPPAPEHPEESFKGPMPVVSAGDFPWVASSNQIANPVLLVPGTRILCARTLDNQLHLIDLETNKVITSVTSGDLHAIQKNRQGEFIAATGSLEDAQRLVFLNLSTEEEVARMLYGRRPMHFSPDGTYIIQEIGDCRYSRRALTDLKQKLEFRAGKQIQLPSALSFRVSGAGSRLTLVNRRGECSVADWMTGDIQIDRLSIEPRIVAATISASGKHVAGIGGQGFFICETEAPEAKQRWPGLKGARRMSFVSEEKVVVVDYSNQVWVVRLGNIQPTKVHTHSVPITALAGGNQTAAILDRNGELHWFDFSP